jgi:hypothetical protein
MAVILGYGSYPWIWQLSLDMAVILGYGSYPGIWQLLIYIISNYF